MFGIVTPRKVKNVRQGELHGIEKKSGGAARPGGWVVAVGGGPGY